MDTNSQTTTTSVNTIVVASGGVNGATTGRARKRPYSLAGDSSSSSSASSSHQLMCIENTRFNDSYVGGCLELADFKCLICMESVQEPTSILCGHTYCRSCIMEAIENKCNRCPDCNTRFTEEHLFPNFALNDIMVRLRSRSSEAVKAEIFESTSPLSPSEAPPTELVKFLANSNLEHLSVNEVDRLVTLLQKRREMMASDDEKCKRMLLEEFLAQLSNIKSTEMEQRQRELFLINRDLEETKTSNINYGTDMGSVTSPASNRTNFDEMPTCTSSLERGFNTHPSREDEPEQHSLIVRKRRMYNNFDELIQVYMDARNVQGTYDDALVVSSIEQEDSEILNEFGKTLSFATQYHRLKALSTLTYNADDDLTFSSTNIVSSIEFDKDNEFFAIAGVKMKIKLFEYVKVITYAVDVHRPTAEITCSARISSVAWNSYYKNSLASSDYNGRVSLWDMSRCTRVQYLDEHQKRVWSVDWSNGDPRLLASGSDDSKVKLWSTQSNKSIANLEIQSNVCCVKFCPESSYHIAVGSADHCIHYYDFRNPRIPLGILCGHQKAVSYVQFTSKCELISASTDSNLKLWNLDESKSCVRSFTGHVNEKNFVGLATDGNFIATGSENNSLYIYYKYITKPLFSIELEDHKSTLENPRPKEDESESSRPGAHFVSAVTWKQGSPVVIAANSRGTIKILELV